jgi:hypothetical protein
VGEEPKQRTELKKSRGLSNLGLRLVVCRGKKERSFSKILLESPTESAAPSSGGEEEQVITDTKWQEKEI